MLTSKTKSAGKDFWRDGIHLKQATEITTATTITIDRRRDRRACETLDRARESTCWLPTYDPTVPGSRRDPFACPAAHFDVN